MDTNLATLARTSFAYYCIGAWRALYPNQPLKLKWYHFAIIHLLSEAFAGRSQRSLINILPRSLKSTIVSVFWPTYLLGLNPGERIMVLTYSDTLAQDLTLLARDLMLSTFYRSVFVDTKLAIKTSTYLRTTQGGERFAGSMTGTVTGRGASWLLVDDAHNGSDIASPKKRKKARKVFQNTIATRMNDPRTDKLIVTGQRFHEDDLSGHLIRQGGWNVLKLQGRATVAADIPIGNGVQQHVEIGDLLDPERFTPEVLANYERDMGGTNYSAQILQEPVPESGDIIKREWMRFQPGLINRLDMEITMSIDTAIKGTPSADYSVCTVWGQRLGYHYLLDMYREKKNLPDLMVDIRAIWADVRPTNILIEDHGSGSQLGDLLRMAGIFATMRPTRGVDKETRLSRASYLFEQHRVVFPEDAPWRVAAVNELFAFPNGRHDDIVDSISQYLIWVQERGVFLVHRLWDEQDPKEGDLWDPMNWAYGLGR